MDHHRLLDCLELGVIMESVRFYQLPCLEYEREVPERIETAS